MGIWITNIWIMNFHLSVIQMSDIQMVVWYSDHHSNTGLVFKWHSNNWPFGDRTTFDHSNTRLVQYSDPHFIAKTNEKIKCYHLLIPKRARLKQCKQLKYQKRVRLMNCNLFPKINMYLIEYFQPLFRPILAPELSKVT